MDFRRHAVCIVSTVGASVFALAVTVALVMGCGSLFHAVGLGTTRPLALVLGAVAVGAFTLTYRGVKRLIAGWLGAGAETSEG